MWARTCLIWISAALPAQVVSPGHFTRAEGNAFSGAGVGLTALPSRQLQIHDDMAGVPLAIGAMAFRRDGGSAGSYAAFGVVCNLFLSTARTTAAAPDPIFDNNHGGDRTLVLASGQIALPATLPGILPRPFDYLVPFPAPFLFGGQGPLCWDLLILVRGNGFRVDLDGVDGVDPDPPSPSGFTGTGCVATGQREPFSLRVQARFDWPRGIGTLGYQGRYGPPSGIGQIYLALHRATFGWVQLPFELPGTRQGPSGPCWLHLNPIAILPVFFDAAGDWSAGYGISLDPALHGTTLLGQLLAVDYPANNWFMVLSDSAWLNIVAPWSVARVGEVLAVAPPFTVGLARPERGAVVQFR